MFFSFLSASLGMLFSHEWDITSTSFLVPNITENQSRHIRWCSECKGCLHTQFSLPLETGVCKHSAAQVGDAGEEGHSPYVTSVSCHLLLSHSVWGVGVLVSFTWHCLEYLRRETQLKNCVDLTGSWASLQGIILVADGGRKAQPTVGSTIFT